MTKAGITATVLLVLLVATNVGWAFMLLDAGVSYTYLQVSFEDNRQALAQVLAVLPLVARENASREEIIAAALRAGGGGEPFEKEGFVWVGSIGLRFNAEGELQEVCRAWSPP